MKILIISSEVVPFSKTGGLADVAGSLPGALARLGHDVRVVSPKYSCVDEEQFNLLPILGDIHVQVGGQALVAEVKRTTIPGTNVPAYFVVNDALFGRPGLYGENGKDYPDNALRYAFFCIASIWLLKGLDWTPDVIMCNDWQTALVPVYLRTRPDMVSDPALVRPKIVFTIHNLAYQGIFDASAAATIGIGPDLMHPAGLEFHGKLNLLKGGLLYSDWISTVSPRYAEEIMTAEYGCGLEGFLRQHGQRVSGVLNGIDASIWDPAADLFIPARYSASNLAGKAKCKALLQKELGLQVQADVPLIVVVSRLDPQKGLDLVHQVVPQILQQYPAQFALLGSGNAKLEAAFLKLASQFEGRASVRIGYDNGLAHRLEAGGDLFMMPSRYEPCGLNQLYSMRYGTPPIVRATGGLYDSVTDTNAQTLASGEATGFVFDSPTPDELLRTVRRALDTYKDSETWLKVVRSGMAKDFSWDVSAAAYGDLFAGLAAQ